MRWPPSTLPFVVAATLASACNLVSPERPFLPPHSDPGPADASAEGGLLLQGTQYSTPRPPPLSGGTLTVLRDGRTAVAADPDRARVFVVDLASNALRFEVELGAQEEPGRVVEGPDGVVFVSLRSSAAVAVVDTATGALRERFAVCTAPRGLAYDADARRLLVACAGGELRTLDAATGALLRSVSLAPDLRDVVLSGGNLYVTRFRVAELEQVPPEGRLAPVPLPHPTAPFRGGDGGVLGSPDPGTFVPSVAWRAIAGPSGGVLVAHQLASMEPLLDRPSAQPSGPAASVYGGSSGCGGVVRSAVTLLGGGQALVSTGNLGLAVLPVDLAVRGDEVAVVAAGNGHDPTVPNVFRFALSTASSLPCDSRAGTARVPGEPTSVAYDALGSLLVQTREPAALHVLVVGDTTPWRSIALSAVSRADTGFAVFHSDAGGRVACASCHPEGGDDGLVHQFLLAGPRRTQTLRGGVLATAPFHWRGELASFEQLLSEVWLHRMGGPPLVPAQRDALASWLDSVPSLPRAPAANADAVARGAALFADPAVGCATCHAGPQHTNSQSVDVGTGGLFQVPRLEGLAQRAPYMHNGCAPTLRDRFGPCGGGEQHGHTAQLAPAQLEDLLAYLGTL